MTAPTAAPLRLADVLSVISVPCCVRASAAAGPEASMESARRFVLEHNQAEYRATFDALLAPECAIHECVPGLPDPMDRAAYEQFIAAFRRALPDVHNTVDEVIAS